MIKKIVKYWTKNVSLLERIILLIIITRCIFNEDNTIWLLAEIFTLISLVLTSSNNQEMPEE